ncbi:hypothetical protein ACULLB_09010 [Enterococcus gallinarum]|nr:hypothetical protein [Enterococcus gallinarum]
MSGIFSSQEGNGGLIRFRKKTFLSKALGITSLNKLAEEIF